MGAGVVTPSPLVVVMVDEVVDTGGIPKFSSTQYESPIMKTHLEPTEGFFTSISSSSFIIYSWEADICVKLGQSDAIV